MRKLAELALAAEPFDLGAQHTDVPLVVGADLLDHAPPIGVVREVPEDENSYYVSCHLPGVDVKDVNISAQGNTLTISGESKRTTPEGRRAVSQETSYGRFERQFAFDTPLEAGKAEATYRDGILEVTLPKAEAHKPRSIQIKPAVTRSRGRASPLWLNWRSIAGGIGLPIAGNDRRDPLLRELGRNVGAILPLDDHGRRGGGAFFGRRHVPGAAEAALARVLLPPRRTCTRASSCRLTARLPPSRSFPMSRRWLGHSDRRSHCCAS